MMRIYDEFTNKKDGLDVGESFIINLFRIEDKIIENINVNLWDEGSGLYSINGISIASSLSRNIVSKKKLIKISDILGRDIKADSKQSTLLYIYDDGSVEKKYILK